MDGWAQRLPALDEQLQPRVQGLVESRCVVTEIRVAGANPGANWQSAEDHGRACQKTVVVPIATHPVVVMNKTSSAIAW